MSTYSTNRTMIRILFAFASSVGRNDTGYYTCSSSEHPSKSALVTIIGNAGCSHNVYSNCGCFLVECEVCTENSDFNLNISVKKPRKKRIRIALQIEAAYATPFPLPV